MGWEQRERGGPYFVRKVRKGHQVQSVYFGNGEAAAQAEQLDRFNRTQRESARLAEQEQQAEWQALDKQNSAYCAEVESLLRHALEAAGYRQHHRGQWRRQRGHK